MFERKATDIIVQYVNLPQQRRLAIVSANSDCRVLVSAMLERHSRLLLRKLGPSELTVDRMFFLPALKSLGI
jgi:hypothetical protein